MTPTRVRQQGMTLIEVMVCLGIVGIAAFGLLKVLSDGFASQRHVGLRAEEEFTRRLLSTYLDCEGTLAKAAINPAAPGGSCTSTSAPGGQAPPYLPLLRKTIDGSEKWLTGPTLLPDGSAQLGAWRVRATCSESEQTLVVRVARIASDGTLAKDPLTKKTRDWDDAGSLLFGGSSGAMPICFTPVSNHRTVTGRVAHLQTLSPPAGFTRAQCRLLVTPEDHHADPGYGVLTFGDGPNWADNHYGGGQAFYDAGWQVTCQYGLKAAGGEVVPSWYGGLCGYMMSCFK